MTYEIETEKRMIIGFCGPSRSGKNTAGEALAALGWYKHEMSELLVKIAEEILGYEVDPEMYEATKDLQLIQDLYGAQSWRDMYIGIGQGMRKHISDSVHVDYMMKRFEDTLGNFYTPNIRADNEAEQIISMGGKIIEVVSNDARYQDGNPTETRISQHLITEMVLNISSVEALHSQVIAAVYT